MATRSYPSRRTRRAAIAWPRDALHIWPRGNYMLIALPNEDGSFTATLFLPKHGPLSFAELDATRAAIERFLSREFSGRTRTDAGLRRGIQALIRSDFSER